MSVSIRSFWKNIIAIYHLLSCTIDIPSTTESPLILKLHRNDESLASQLMFPACFSYGEIPEAPTDGMHETYNGSFLKARQLSVTGPDFGHEAHGLQPI